IKWSQPYVCIWEPSYNREFVVFVGVVGHYVPLCIMIVCYSRVVTVVLRRRAVGAVATTSRDKPPVSTTLAMVSCSSNERRGGRSPAVGAAPPAVRTLHVLPSTGNGGGSTSDADAPSAVDTATAVNAARRQRKRDHERHVAVTLGYIIALFLVCWGPFYIVFDISAWAPDLVSPGLYTFCFWSTYLNSALNPFVYNFSNQEFRDAFKKIVLLRWL
ncbi:PREDICTED: alpha-1A adrenergic receptor-like, partial [Priapulus caudatus]|uniref:Alpha-1A adrenergic receptor-like n=1 Tax=Priapulus caudatus TaxID=37621 RepID=A0ABM1F6J1_PRICU